jgi:hypothetical protein
MGKGNNSYQLSAWTTGSGIAIGTNVQLGGVWIGTAATTLTLLRGTTAILTVSGVNTFVGFGCNAVAISGALNGTSSGGSFAVVYR